MRGAPARALSLALLASLALATWVHRMELDPHSPHVERFEVDTYRYFWPTPADGSCEGIRQGFARTPLLGPKAETQVILPMPESPVDREIELRSRSGSDNALSVRST